MAAAGLGDDLLIANEVVDPATARGAGRPRDGARSPSPSTATATIAAAAARRDPRVVVDVDVGLPRCGCDPADAGRLADLARAKGLEVRGVMGYEGHLMALEDREAARPGRRGDGRARAGPRRRRRRHHLGRRHRHVRPPGTTGVTEVQAGSYALMDTAYAKLGLPFAQALFVVGTVISVRPGHAVADVGLKALGMDHGNPAIDRRDGVVLQRRARDVRTRRRTPGRRSGARDPGPRRPDGGDARGRLARRRRRRSSSCWTDRPPRLVMTRAMLRHRHGSAWVAVAGMAATAARPSVARVRWGVRGGPPLMPWSALSAAPLAAGPPHRATAGLAAAVRRRRRRRRRDGGAARVPPASRPPTRRPAAAIVHANLLYVNRRVADVPRRSPRSTPTCSRSASSRRPTPPAAGVAAGAAYPYQIELPAATPAAPGCGAAGRSPSR